MNIITALTDKQVLGGVFGTTSWGNWRAILAGAFGLPLGVEAAATFQRLTARAPLDLPCRELLVLAGRRGGKSHIAAAIAVYLATLRRWKLAAGEVGMVLVLAADRDQARVAFRYVLGLIENSCILSPEIESTTVDAIRLRSGIEICIGTSDRAAVRGRTLIAVVCDEIAFWGSDAEEVLRAIRPGMASQPDAMLVMITTTYSQRGPAFELFRRYFGVSDPRILVVRATTRDLNDSIPQSFIDEELSRDPQAAAAEYLAEFRGDLEALFDMALIERATRNGIRELPCIARLANGTPVKYHAALDVSGGRQDATAAAVSFGDGANVVVAACRRWVAPHDPVQVAREVAQFLAGYRLSSAVADQYGAELSRSIYAEAGVSLMAVPINRSEAYLHMLPLFTSGRIEIPDEPTLRTELLGLTRRTRNSGRDSVDHHPGAHDDLANAVALSAWSAAHRGPARDQVFVVHSTITAEFDTLERPHLFHHSAFFSNPDWQIR